MLHVWLIPAIVVVIVVLAVLYLILKYKGGTGIRTPGRTLLDEPDDEDNPLDQDR